MVVPEEDEVDPEVEEPEAQEVEPDLDRSPVCVDSSVVISDDLAGV